MTPSRKLAGWLRLQRQRFYWIAWEAEAVFIGSGQANPYGANRPDTFPKRDDGFPR